MIIQPVICAVFPKRTSRFDTAINKEKSFKSPIALPNSNKSRFIFFLSFFTASKEKFSCLCFFLFCFFIFLGILFHRHRCSCSYCWFAFFFWKKCEARVWERETERSKKKSWRKEMFEI